jgi:opacity protein-like surface antigen
MKIHGAFLWAAGFCLASTGAFAQSRDTGWEFGADVVYQTSQDIGFTNGTTTFEDDIGLSLYAGYRMSSRLEFQFGLDWSNVDYKGEFVPPQLPGITFNVDGEIEEFTPFAKVNFNFLEGPITPFVSANVGWSFIDTNIPEGPAQIGCWWDPWYGEICTTYQPTRSNDSFTYGVGLGVRWDLSTGYSLRLGYEKQWYDVDNADSPDFDRFKLGIVFVY